MATIQNLNFNPTSIPGCQLWLDATTGLNSGVWMDKSTSSNNATLNSGTITLTRVNGLQAFSFNNVLMTYNNNLIFSGTTGTSCFFVFSVPNLGNGHLLYSLLNAASHLLWTDQNLYENIGFSSRQAIAGFSHNTLQMYANIANRAGSTFIFRNGSQLFSGTFGSEYRSLAYSIGNPSYLWSGTACEILVYTRTLLLSEQQQVEGYLAWKWGLQGNLPSNHPYRLAAPNSAGLVYPIGLRIPAPIQSLQSSTSVFSFFNPLSIPGCQIWLDGADSSRIVLSGSTVNSWLDKSGLGNTFTRITGTPTYSANSVVFTKANLDLFRTTNSLTFLATSSIIFYVAQITPTGDLADIMAFPDNGLRSIRYNSTGILVGTTSAGGDGNDFAQNNYYINGFFNPATTATIFTNIHLITAINVNVIGSTRVTLSDSFMSRYINGRIYEVLYYASGLTTAQRQQIEGYLAWKWGIVGTLPSNHPFRNGPPGLTMPAPILTNRILRQAMFSPRSIAGLSLWLDGQDPLNTGIAPTNGSSLGAWVDKSGFGRNATPGTSAIYTTNAINGYPAPRFNGSSTNYDTQDLYSNRSFSLFFVIRRQAQQNSMQIIGGTALNPNQNLHLPFRSGTNISFAFYSNDLEYISFPNFTNASTEPAYLLGYTYTPGTRIIWLNGTNVAQDANASNLTSSPGMKIASAFGANFYNGFIGEIIVLNGVPSNSRISVEGYLAWKWGLQGSLPANHPFKNFQPPPN